MSRVRVRVRAPVRSSVRVYARERENGEESERASAAKRVGCENTIACTTHMRAVNALNITLQIMRIYSTLAPCFSLLLFLPISPSLFLSLR